MNLCYVCKRNTIYACSTHTHTHSALHLAYATIRTARTSRRGEPRDPPACPLYYAPESHKRAARKSPGTICIMCQCSYTRFICVHVCICCRVVAHRARRVADGDRRANSACMRMYSVGAAISQTCPRLRRSARTNGLHVESLLLLRDDEGL